MRASLKEKALAFTCSREFQNLGACVLIVSWTCLLPENISEMDSQIQLTSLLRMEPNSPSLSKLFK